MGWSKGPKAAEYAETVFDLIPLNDWVQIEDLEATSGLSDGQIRSGVAYLREVYDLKDCLLSGPRGYSFSTDMRDISQFRAARLRCNYTSLDRTYKSMKPMLDAISQREAQTIEKQFVRVLEDIHDLI